MFKDFLNNNYSVYREVFMHSQCTKALCLFAR